MKNNISFFLDSGAFSAFTKGVEIDIIEYCQFIKDNIGYIDQYAVLDAIGDAEKTLQNQKVMEEEKLKPIPCFHYGEDEKYLKYYIDNYDYVALGGMVPISTKDLVIWLDRLFSNYLCDNNGYVKLKIHGFGMTSFDLIFRYPWYSIDSVTWVMCSQFGQIILPNFTNNKFMYNKKPVKLDISEQSPRRKKEGMHFDNISKKEKDIVLNYLNQKEFTLEQVQTDYLARWEINLQYYIDLEKNLGEILFKHKSLEKGFFL